MPAEISTRQMAETLAEALYHQALDLVASGDPAAAAGKFREALALDPDLLEAMHGLIRALQDAGDYDQAIRRRSRTHRPRPRRPPRPHQPLHPLPA